MHLGFHYHIPVLEEVSGELKLPSYFACFIDSLASQVDCLTLFMHSPTPADQVHCDTPIQADNVHLEPIGLHSRLPTRLINASRHVAPLRRRRADLDALLIRGPSPLLPHFAKAAGTLPVALLLVGDYLSLAWRLDQPLWKKALIAVWSFWNLRQQDRIARTALTLVNSRDLLKRYRGLGVPAIETRTTTLSKTDLSFEAERPLHSPLRVLYSGRFDRTKGLFDILEAVRLLNTEGLETEFWLVGWSPVRDPTLEQLMEHATEGKIRHRVVNHGRKKVGPELLSVYRQADIFVIASQDNFEGFPRAIWEALGSSLPVIATSVGSIPLFLNDAQHALISPPREPLELVNRIKLLVDDRALRRRLTTQGFDLARDNTLDARAEDLADHLHSHIAGKTTDEPAPLDVEVSQ